MKNKKVLLIMVILITLAIISIIFCIFKLRNFSNKPIPKIDGITKTELNKTDYNTDIEEKNEDSYENTPIDTKETNTDEPTTTKENNNSSNKEITKSTTTTSSKKNTTTSNKTESSKKQTTNKTTSSNKTTNSTPKKEDNSVDTSHFDYRIHKGRIDCTTYDVCQNKALKIQFKFSESISNSFQVEVISKSGNTLGYFNEFVFTNYKYSSSDECKRIGSEIKNSLSDRVISYSCDSNNILKIKTDY